MKTELIATNAELKTSPTGTTICARDASGNELELVLNERLNKRILVVQVNARIAEIMSSLTGITDTLRTNTDAAEASLREVHNKLFSTLRSELGIRQPRVESESPNNSSGNATVIIKSA